MRGARVTRGSQTSSIMVFVFIYLNHLVFHDDWQTGSPIVRKSVPRQHARSTLNLLTGATEQSLYIWRVYLWVGRRIGVSDVFVTDATAAGNLNGSPYLMSGGRKGLASTTLDSQVPAGPMSLPPDPLRID